SLQIVGATGRWYRVQLDDGVAGYVPAREVKRAPRPPEPPPRIALRSGPAGSPSSDRSVR
ncbi:MAG TPA: hypothetical protein VGQ52_20715, partial [Gemmatimonadaceae bacterium]|nr:hypothetical protein [Gemmatimonadaceae bacterium]